MTELREKKTRTQKN